MKVVIFAIILVIIAAFLLKNEEMRGALQNLLMTEKRRAIAYFDGGGPIRGQVIFEEDFDLGDTVIRIDLSGVPSGKHGIHIHEFGDLSNGCESAGPHFNPHNVTHGDIHSGHVGDMGNIYSESGDGRVNEIKRSKLIKLRGPNSVIGRTLVIHAGEDDLGAGDSPESKTTGNSGARIACAIIGVGQI